MKVYFVSGGKVFKLDLGGGIAPVLQIQPLNAGTGAFVGSQILAALVVGLLTAFAFQLLLTTFGIAIGITALKFRSNTSAEQPSLEQSESKPATLGSTISKIGTAAGFGILTTINTVLFAACFLATKFTQIGDPLSGAIVGIVIWSGYFLILTWVSSAAVTSLVSSVLGSATAGFRQIVSTIGAALKGQDDNLLTEETALALVRQEVQSALNPADLQKTVEEYLKTVSPPKLDLTAVQQGLAELLQELDLENLARAGKLDKVDRQSFINLIQHRTSLAEPEIEQVVDQLDHLWQQAINRYPKTDLNTELLNFLQTADPAELKFDQIKTRLEQLLADPSRQNPQTSGLFSPLQQLDFNRIKQLLLKRLDLSELDVEQLWGQLQTLKQAFVGESDESELAQATAPFSTIKADVEDYLLNAYPWHLTADTVKKEFREVLYDPEAAPEQVRLQLEQLQQAEFEQILHQRDDLSNKQIHRIAERLEKTRLQVLETAKAAEIKEQGQYLQEHLGSYLQSIDPATLQSDRFVREVKALLVTLSIAPEALVAFSNHAAELLQERTDLTSEEAEQVAARLKRLGDRLISKAQDSAISSSSALSSSALELWHKLETYLRHTNSKKLTPERVERKLQKLLEEVQEEVIDFELSLPKFDRQELVGLLDRRTGLNEEQREQILERIEATWSEFLQATPGLQTNPASDQIVDQFVEHLTAYLKQLEGVALDWSNLDFNSILPDLLDASKTGAWALRQQLNRLSWDTLKEQLQQIPTLNQTQIQQIVDRLQALVRRILKTPRRWAARTQTTVPDFPNILKDYLQQTDKTEFSSENIRRSLQWLLQETQVGSARALLGASLAGLNYLAQIDRSALIALLLQRQDLTTAEASAIADQIESVRQGLLEQAERLQNQAQATVDQVVDRIGSYLDSLVPSFNYEAVKQNLSGLFDDQPTVADLSQSLYSVLSAGTNSLGRLDQWRESAAQTLRDRFDQLSHDTVMTLLKSRQDLSESVQQHWIVKAEGLRDRLMQQVEQLQQETQVRLEELKQQAQKRVEETRKAAATAAWWLFATASTAAVTAAMAGALAAGLDLTQLTQLLQVFSPMK